MHHVVAALLIRRAGVDDMGMRSWWERRALRKLQREGIAGLLRDYRGTRQR